MGHGGARAPTFGSIRARGGGALINVNCYYYVIAINNKHALNFAAADFAGNCHILS